MPSDDQQGANTKKNLLPDLIIPLLALVFALYYFTTISEVPWIAQASAVTVGALLIAAIAAFALRCWRELARGDAALRWPAIDKRLAVKRAVLLALTVAYVAVIEALGFTLTTFLFLFFAILLLSSLRNWHRAAAVALGCSAVGYLVFIALFKTRFPLGFAERLLERWLS